MSLENMIKDMAKAGKEASRELRKVSRALKDAALRLMAEKLKQREKRSGRKTRKIFRSPRNRA